MRVPIAKRMKQALSLRGMRQVDLIERTGISKVAISSYISGKYEPRNETLQILAKALNVSDVWLAGFDVPIDCNSSEDEFNFCPEARAVNQDKDLQALVRAVQRDRQLLQVISAIVESYEHTKNIG